MADLDICFVSSEVAPFAKTGGLADVAGALPAVLREQGHDVRVFMPLHARVDASGHDFIVADFLRDVAACRSRGPSDAPPPSFTPGSPPPAGSPRPSPAASGAAGGAASGPGARPSS